MAEEQEDVQDEVVEEQAPEKKSSLKMIVVLLVVLSALGGGGYYAYITYFQSQAPGAMEEGSEETVEEPTLGIMFSLDPFVVNLAGSQGKRFLKVTVSLELSAPEVHVEIKENVQKITDSILVLLSSKNFEDVYSIQGKFKLKDEIATRVNRFLSLGHIREVYFTEFIIQ